MPSRSNALRVDVSCRCVMPVTSRRSSLNRRGRCPSEQMMATLHLSPIRARMPRTSATRPSSFQCAGTGCGEELSGRAAGAAFLLLFGRRAPGSLVTGIVSTVYQQAEKIRGRAEVHSRARNVMGAV